MDRFDKIYNYYDLQKEYHKGYMSGSIKTLIIMGISFAVGLML